VNKVRQLAIVTLSVVVFLLVASYFFAMLLGLALFFITPAGLDFSPRPVQLYLVFGFDVPFALNAGQLFLILWSIFGLCFLSAWRLRESFPNVVRKALSRPLSTIFNNWLFAMPIIASMLFAAVFQIMSLQELFGVRTGSIPEPRTSTEYFDLYLRLSYAPLFEEAGFRIIPIGAFLLAYLFLIQSERRSGTMSSWQRFKLSLSSFLYPDGAKRMVGVKNVAVNGIRNGINRGEWIMLLVTAIIFGVAHPLSGIGWEVGKITSTFLQGFVFGVVYLAYGFQAPILMHWFFNYYFYTYALSTLYYANTFGILIWIETITLTLGRLGLIIFTILGLKKISTPLEKSEAGT